MVNVSSCAHFMGSWFDWSDPHLKTFYSPEQAYGNSKAAQVTCHWPLYYNTLSCDWPGDVHAAAGAAGGAARAQPRLHQPPPGRGLHRPLRQRLVDEDILSGRQVGHGSCH